MANLKLINELEIINDEANIIGTENVLVEKDGSAKLVPMNMIKASSDDAHTHDNKELLDTYTQTEADLADAVVNKHAHTNATVLESITAEKVAAWDGAAEGGNAAPAGYVIDMTSDEYQPTNTAYGDSIVELFKNGVPVTIYSSNGYYYMPHAAFIDQTTNYVRDETKKLLIRYNSGTSSYNVSYIALYVS